MIIYRVYSSNISYRLISVIVLDSRWPNSIYSQIFQSRSNTTITNKIIRIIKILNDSFQRNLS